MKAEGYNGRMEIRGDDLVLSRKLLFGRSKGEKAIAIRAINALQFKPAGLLTTGYLQVAFSGSKESKGGYFDALKDENTIAFHKQQQPQFEAIRDEVNRRRAHGETLPTKPQSDPAAEIARYADLHQQGILTDEEFAAKKKQLLGL